jgi:ABC-2 type transport system permease protein
VKRLFQNAIRHHFVLRNFVSRDLKVKYRGTLFGYLWSLLEPLSLVLIYYFVFVIIARRGGPDYPLIVVLGILPYTYFSSVVTGGSTALTQNRGLIRRVYLPRELFILGHAGSQTVVLLLSLVAVVPFLIAYGTYPGGRIVYLVPAILLIGFAGTGLALVLSCANVLYRDVGYVLRVVLRLGFYGSPVIYPIELVPDRLLDVYALNPMAVYLTMVRSSFTNQPLPMSGGHVALAVSVAVLLFAIGAQLFQRWQARAVKYL